MSSEQTVKLLMDKAKRARKSAHLLFEHDDIDGACNRAYYAMFGAARVALLASGVFDQNEMAKTHRGILIAFGMHIVKDGPISREVGRLLQRAQELRHIADYRGDSIDREEAGGLITDMDTFVSAIETQYVSRNNC